MSDESSSKNSYSYEYVDSIELDIRAAEAAQRINPALADHLLGQEPFIDRASDMDIRKILAIIAGTGFMADPVVMANFRGLQSRLLDNGDILDEIVKDSKETQVIGVEKRQNSYRRKFIESSLLSAAPNWLKQAECRGLPVKLFFRNDVASQNKVINKYCKLCQVFSECAEYGKDEKFGVWGGIVKKRMRYGNDKNKSDMSVSPTGAAAVE